MLELFLIEENDLRTWVKKKVLTNDSHIKYLIEIWIFPPLAAV